MLPADDQHSPPVSGRDVARQQRHCLPLPINATGLVLDTAMLLWWVAATLSITILFKLVNCAHLYMHNLLF